MSEKGSSARQKIKNRCEELQIDYSHFKKDGGAHEKTKIPIEDILNNFTSYECTSRLKKRLVNEGYLPYKCAICGNEGDWNGLPLILQLDHINGNHSDNSLANLRLLCPNCHSQTKTFSGKNIKLLRQRPAKFSEKG